MLSKTERDALEVVVSQHKETRRGAQGRVLRMALAANGPARRRALDDAMQSLLRRGLAQATCRWHAGDQTVMGELAWLRETAQQLVAAGGEQ